MSLIMTDFNPTLFWVTGLSGAGKTTIAKVLVEKLRSRGQAAILLDGDVLRQLYNDDFGHDRESRFMASMQYARFCKMLVEQQVHVVCSTMSLFHHTQEWNRSNVKSYFEIFLDVPIEELIQRDSKKIYSRALSGELKNIVGIDIAAELPKKPDIVIKNLAETSVTDNVKAILTQYDQKYHA
jgi:adenylylsulfate kinase-like enzyme